MPDPLDALAGKAAPREVAGNNPLPLDGADDVWLLRSGWLDLFAVLSPDGDAPGPRLRLCRVESGQILFGLPAPTGSVLAAGGPGSRVFRLSREQFGELALRPELTAPLAVLLDGWVGGLTGGVVRHRPPRKALLLEPGAEVRLTGSGAAVPAHGVVWVRHESGASRFLGRVGQTLTAADGWFPLAGPGWLAAADAETVLTTLATKEMFADGAIWPALDRFHHVVLAFVASNAAATEHAERRRLRRRQDFERRLFRATLSHLADVVARPDEGPDDLEAEEGPQIAPQSDSLLAACRSAGARLGIVFRTPLDAGGNGRVDPARRSDPVGDIARASRVRVRRVRLAGDWWEQDNGPLLAFRAADERPVALTPRSPSRYELVDPAAGTRAPVTRAVAASLSPIAYTFYRPFPPGPLTPWGLLRFALRCTRRGDWLAVLVLGLAGSALGMFTPVAIGWIYGAVIPAAQTDQLSLIVLALLTTAATIALFQFARGVAALRLEGKMDGAVQAAIWDRLLNLPAPFFRRYTAGDLALRALGIGEMRQVLTDVALSVLLSFLFSLTYFGLLFYYDARLAGLACGVFAVALAAVALSAWVQLRYQRGVYHVRGRVAGLVLQLITGISRLRLAGAEDRALARWVGDFGVQKKLAFRARSAANVLTAFNAALPVLGTMALFALVAALPPGAVTLGAFLAFNAAFVQVLFSAIMMASVVGYAVQVVPLYERAKPILEAPPEVDPAKAAPGDLSGDIELSHVSFRYQADGPLVLDDVSIHVRAGEFVAFVGPSGAGKSTLIRLLLGFESPTAGSIAYDREDLAALDRQALRRQIGVVLQDGKLMAGDLFGNIVGSAPLTLEDAWEAARLAGLEQDIHDMPMGMQTVVSEGGGTLSGGQRQRLMIARAVVSRPRILLLDEATSALDNQTQADVSRSLDRLKATRIVVAHRLSTIEHADCIYVLDGGRIVQRGRYAELVRQPGLFADLARRQIM